MIRSRAIPKRKTTIDSALWMTQSFAHIDKEVVVHETVPNRWKKWWRQRLEWKEKKAKKKSKNKVQGQGKLSSFIVEKKT